VDIGAHSAGSNAAGIRLNLTLPGLPTQSHTVTAKKLIPVYGFQTPKALKAGRWARKLAENSFLAKNSYLKHLTGGKGSRIGAFVEIAR
jgi:hypothetical protein